MRFVVCWACSKDDIVEQGEDRFNANMFPAIVVYPSRDSISFLPWHVPRLASFDERSVGHSSDATERLAWGQGLGGWE